MKNMKSKKPLIIGLIVILAVVGIYLIVRTSQFSGPAPIASTSGSLTVGNPAPDFNATTIDGQQFSLAAHKGKPVILFAMFGSCGECIPVGQTLNQIQRDYNSQGVAVLAIDILDGEQTSILEQYRNYIHATFPFVSYNESIVQAYQLTAPEITYVIDKNGDIADINQTTRSYDQYKQELDKIL